MKTTQARIEVTCPDCGKKSFSPEVCLHYSCNCAHCGLLLLVRNGIVSSFHEKMRENYEAYERSKQEV